MPENKIGTTCASSAIRYAVMAMCINASSLYVLNTYMSNKVSPDKLSLLIILFNIISVASQAFFSVFSDAVNDNTGVRLGVLLFLMGYFIPASLLGATVKTVLLGIGAGIFYSFASSCILTRSKGKPLYISALLCGYLLGFAVYSFSPLFARISAALLMISATPADEYRVKNKDNIKAETASLSFKAFSSTFLLLSIALMSFTLSGISLSWSTNSKDTALIYVSAAIGVLVGGYLYKFLGFSLTALSGYMAGSLLIFFASDIKLLSLIGIMLIFMPSGCAVFKLFEAIKCRPSFAFALFSMSVYLGYELKFYLKASAQNDYGMNIIILSSAVCIISSGIFDIKKLLTKLIKTGDVK